MSRFFACQNVTVLLASVFLPISNSAHAQESGSVDPAIKAMIVGEAVKNLKIRPINDEAISKVFAASLLEASIGFSADGGVIGYFLQRDGIVTVIKNNEMGKKVPDFAQFIRDDFKITSEANLLELRAALLFFSPNSPPSDDIPKYGRYGDNWAVVTGTFIDDYNAYIVRMGPRAGKIREIEYIQRLPGDALGKP